MTPTSEERKHTPLPWGIDRESKAPDIWISFFKDGKAWTDVATFPYIDDEQKETDNADAELIVTAVNSYYSLKEENENFRTRLSEMGNKVINAVDIIQIQIARLKGMPESRAVNTMIEDLTVILNGPMPESRAISTLTEQNAKLKLQIADLEGFRNAENEREIKLIENIGIAARENASLKEENQKLREALEEAVLHVDSHFYPKFKAKCESLLEESKPLNS